MIIIGKIAEYCVHEQVYNAAYQRFSIYHDTFLTLQDTLCRAFKELILNGLVENNPKKGIITPMLELLLTPPDPPATVLR